MTEKKYAQNNVRDFVINHAHVYFFYH